MATVSIILLGIVGVLWIQRILHYIRLQTYSKTLPYLSENFVGRQNEMQDLLERVRFDLTELRIINIVGSPGFGKSTLAIHVGHRLVDQGVDVHYINMAEFPDEQVQHILTEKILKSSDILAKTITFERLLRWARERYNHQLIVLDNCDDILNKQKEKFQETIVKIVEISTNIKVLMTSREVSWQNEYFDWYEVHELSPEAALSLLDNKLQSKVKLALEEKEEIAELTGNVPLALHIVASLLKMKDPPTPASIIEELNTNPIPFLSPNELPTKLRINASISLSYRFLDENLKKAACFLAHFPGSFDKPSALGVYNEYQTRSYEEEPQDPLVDQKVLRALVDRSLLEYNQRTKRYQYHRLIREFFLERLREKGDSGRNMSRAFAIGFRYHFAQWLHQHTANFKTQYVNSLRFLDTERHNIYRLLEELKQPYSIQYIIYRLQEEFKQTYSLQYIIYRLLAELKQPHSLQNHSFLMTVEAAVQAVQLLEELKQPHSLQHHSFLMTVEAAVQATKQEFLTCRFTMLEVCLYLESVLQYFDEDIQTFQEQAGSGTVCDISSMGWDRTEFYSQIYMRLLLTYGELVAKLKGEATAITVLEERYQHVYQLTKKVDEKCNKNDLVNQNRDQDSLVLTTSGQRHTFLITLSNLHLALGHHSTVIQYQHKILDDVRSCEKCTYNEIGFLHLNSNNEEESAKYFELSLEHDDNPTTSKANTLVHLFRFYRKSWSWNTDKVELTLNRLVNEYHSMMELPGQILVYNRKVVTETIHVLRQGGKKEEANLLENRLFETISMVSDDMDFQVRPKDALQFLEAAEESENHTKTILWGTLLLKPFENYDNFSLDDKKSILNIHMSVSIAKLHSGQFFSGLDDMEYSYTNFILQQENNELFTKERKTACFYLIPRFKYVYQCYIITSFKADFKILEIVSNLFLPVPFITCTKKSRERPAQTLSKLKDVATTSSEAQLVEDVLMTVGLNTGRITNMVEAVWHEVIWPIWCNPLFRFLLNLPFLSVWFLICCFALATFPCSILGTGYLALAFFHQKILARRYYAIILNPLSSIVLIQSVVALSQITNILLQMMRKILTNHFFEFTWKSMHFFDTTSNPNHVYVVFKEHRYFLCIAMQSLLLSIVFPLCVVILPYTTNHIIMTIYTSTCVILFNIIILLY